MSQTPPTVHSSCEGISSELQMLHKQSYKLGRIQGHAVEVIGFRQSCYRYDGSNLLGNEALSLKLGSAKAPMYMVVKQSIAQRRRGKLSIWLSDAKKPVGERSTKREFTEDKTIKRLWDLLSHIGHNEILSTQEVLKQL